MIDLTEAIYVLLAFFLGAMVGMHIETIYWKTRFKLLKDKIEANHQYILSQVRVLIANRETKQ